MYFITDGKHFIGIDQQGKPTIVVNENCVYFVFQNGKSVLDSQNRPRMYKTEQQFKKKFPGHNHTEVVELVKYAPVRYGNWIPHDDELDGLTNECSVCHCEGMIRGNYCRHCGAKMGMDDSEDWEG